MSWKIARGSLVAVAALAFCVACGPRQVEVGTSPTPSRSADVSLRVTNRLDQPVNVYVSTSGIDTFVRQVAANSTEQLAVPSVAPGTVVTLKATTLDGARTFSKANVALAGTYSWQLP